MTDREKLEIPSMSLDRSQLRLNLHNCAAPARPRNNRYPPPVPPPPPPPISSEVELPLWTVNRTVRPADLNLVLNNDAIAETVLTSGQPCTSAEAAESPQWSLGPTVRPTDNPISMTEKSMALRLMLSKDHATVSCCRNADSPVADLRKMWDDKKPSDMNRNNLKPKIYSSKYWTKRIFNARFKNGITN